MKKRTAFITGATGGIGEAIAQRFSKEGYHLVLHYHQNDEKARALKKTLVKKDQHVLLLKGDLSDEKTLASMLERLVENDVMIDVLINNAGIKIDAPITKMSDEDFKKVMQINVNGAWMLMKRLVPLMQQQGYGRIINITSGVAKDGNVNQTNYGASKAALENITKSLAREVGQDGITVNAVAPGLIETTMTKNVDEAHKKAYIERVPIRRLVECQDVAQACAFFASEKSGAISGQILGVNGGLR